MAPAPSPLPTGVASLRSRKDALGYTDRQRDQLSLLRRRDRQVRLHEQAHIAAAAGLTIGAPKYTLAKGPDGNVYAIAGYVSIDTAPAPSPEATIEKAKKIKKAATAPSDPSTQDMRVVARATMMEMSARGQLKTRGREGVEAGEGASPAPATIHKRYPARLRADPGQVLGVA